MDKIAAANRLIFLCFGWMILVQPFSCHSAPEGLAKKESGFPSKGANKSNFETQASVAIPANHASTPITIIDRPILFNGKRIDLTKEYILNHYGISSKSIEIVPKMVVIHWTAVPSLEGSFNTFNGVQLPFYRKDIRKASELNVSIHFLVDRNGLIYRLMPETWMARHIIGLNYCSIGIENVGDGTKWPLTDAQLRADENLIRYLVEKYPSIEYLIGHHEYGKFKESHLWLEKDPNYFTIKSDPGDVYMKQLRINLSDLDLKAKPE